MFARGFEYVTDESSFNSAKSKGIPLPQRSTSASAGYDFISPIDVNIRPGDIFIIWTDVKVKMPKDECLKIYIRSSLALNRIVLANSVGIIDSDYYGNSKNDGNIGIPILNLNRQTQQIKKGDKIAQGIFEKFLVVDNDMVETQRQSGFGSTGA